MSLNAIILCATALILVTVAFRLRRRRRPPIAAAPPWASSAEATRKPSDVLVWIDADGSARELSDTDRAYVDAEFSPFDGARPFVKTHYNQRNGWGELRGYLPRGAVPPGVRVAPAPVESAPQLRTPDAVAEALRGLARSHRPGDARKIRFRFPRAPE